MGRKRVYAVLSRVWTNKVVNAGKTQEEIGKRATLPSTSNDTEFGPVSRLLGRKTTRSTRDQRIEGNVLAKLATFPSTRGCVPCLFRYSSIDRSSLSLCLFFFLLATFFSFFFFSLLLYSPCLCLSLSQEHRRCEGAFTGKYARVVECLHVYRDEIQNLLRDAAQKIIPVSELNLRSFPRFEIPIVCFLREENHSETSLLLHVHLSPPPFYTFAIELANVTYCNTGYYRKG